MRRPILAGNWKMNTDLSGAVELASTLGARLSDVADRDIVIIPPFPFLGAVCEAVEGSPIAVGAQNCHARESGAFTGEVSVSMIKSVKARFCIVGHSERRQYQAETDEECNEKIRALLSAGLTPIYCVGEGLKVREAGGTIDLVEGQIRGGLSGFSSEEAESLVVAYEPIWAIGTGKVATPEEAQEVHAHIRRVLASLFGEEAAGNVPVQYGGSVNPDNVDALMACSDIDGALVGGASLKAESFERIVRFKNT